MTIISFRLLVVSNYALMKVLTSILKTLNNITHKIVMLLYIATITSKHKWITIEKILTLLKRCVFPHCQ